MRVNTTGFLCTAKHSVLTLLCRAELSSGTTGSSAILQSKHKPCAGEPALHGSSNKNTATTKNRQGGGCPSQQQQQSICQEVERKHRTPEEKAQACLKKPTLETVATCSSAQPTKTLGIMRVSNGYARAWQEQGAFWGSPINTCENCLPRSHLCFLDSFLTPRQEVRWVPCSTCITNQNYFLPQEIINLQHSGIEKETGKWNQGLAMGWHRGSVKTLKEIFTHCPQVCRYDYNFNEIHAGFQ